MCLINMCLPADKMLIGIRNEEEPGERGMCQNAWDILGESKIKKRKIPQKVRVRVKNT